MKSVENRLFRELKYLDYCNDLCALGLATGPLNTLQDLRSYGGNNSYTSLIYELSERDNWVF